MYGKHKYSDPVNGRSDCKYGCGCWVGSFSSDGPLGVDIFGLCPNNPMDGEPLRPNIDYEDVVKQRIKGLEKALSQTKIRAAKAEARLKGPRKQLIKRLEKVEAQLTELRRKLSTAADMAIEIQSLRSL